MNTPVKDRRQYMCRYTGKLISEIDHIIQSIMDILTTLVGTRVMRRNYGSILPLLVDKPANDITIMQLVSATVIAIYEWETRIELANIEVSEADMQGKMDIAVVAILKATGEEFGFALPLLSNAPVSRLGGN